MSGGVSLETRPARTKDLENLNQVIENLEQLMKEARPWTQKGRVADYIPELKRMNQDALGVTIVSAGGKEVTAGDCHMRFTMQSISKVFSLALALMDQGMEQVFSHVGMEPTGDPFNSMIKLETLKPRRPLNPMINAGAIAVCSLIKGRSAEDKFERLLHLVRQLSGNPTIHLNVKVYQSEKRTGDRNRALAYMMRESGVIHGDVEAILDLYFRQCAIEVTCRDVAHMAVCLAQGGKVRGMTQSVLPRDVVRILNTLMMTCGMYNASGEFAIRVGVPAKSGVSGGIMAVVPGKLGIGVIGPALDEKGNSLAGIKLLEACSRCWKLSVF